MQDQTTEAVAETIVEETTNTLNSATTTTETVVNNTLNSATTTTETETAVNEALQVSSETLNSAGTEFIEAPEEGLRIMDLLLEGGTASTLIVSVLGVLLLLAIFVFFERFFAFSRASKLNIKFNSDLHDLISKGKLEEADDLCDYSNAPESYMLSKGISRIGRPFEEINIAMENAGALELAKIEKNLGVLATVAGVGPMIGFFGTVVGMIMAFYEMANVEGQADPKILASGIFTAMGTTAAGLVVGIIAYLMYNYFTIRLSGISRKLQVIASDFMDLINKPS